MENRVDELQGRPCSTRELALLEVWVRSKIHWSAHILQVIVRQRGYLIEVDTTYFQHPQWYGVDFDEIAYLLHVTTPAYSST
ncbi:MAG: hypothetical protein GTO18_06240 [Anaerolineales bacterium]|nr:hypothetical protein [Anaerolineales bacterium]